MSMSGLATDWSGWGCNRDAILSPKVSRITAKYRDAHDRIAPVSGIRPKKEATRLQRLALASPLEKYEQRMLFAWADAHSDPRLRLLYAIPNAGGYTGGFKANMLRVIAMKKEGSRKGFPDIGLPIAAHGSHGLYIEMKREDATPSDTKPEQAAWHKALKDQGYMVAVCRGFEEACDTINFYLGLE